MFSSKIERVIDAVDRLREQVDDHYQIPRDEAAILAQIVRMGRCVSICEIGTSYGFSTLHLATATREHGGHVHSLDMNPKKFAAATRHLTEAGLTDVVSLYQGDARELLRSLSPPTPFDFAFIDADKSQSFEYLDLLLPKLAPSYIIVTDNTTTHAQELASFVTRLRELPGVTSCQVPIGNGFELTVRRS